MYPKKGYVILHVDMNSFYASVEMAYNPLLKGKPLAIAGNPEERRGIIVTCSYEARKFGVRATMPVWEAKKLCPNLLILPPNFERYQKASSGIFEILRSFSNLVEPVSIDEGYVDITESYELGSPLYIAKTIQIRIMEQLDLPCSIGIAPNKFLAKMASDMKKPLGITVLRKRDIQSKLWPLPVVEMHGIGKKTAEKLKTIGIYSIGDIAKANEIQMEALLGINGLKLKERANGIDHRHVDPDAVSEHKSIGNSTTLPRDTYNQQELLKICKNLSEKVSQRLKRKGFYAENISITIRYKSRKTITRSKKLNNPIVQTDDIFEAARNLFLQHWSGDSVRLLGVTAIDLIEDHLAVKQLDLFTFEKDAKKEPLLQTLELLQQKYGKESIHKGIKEVKDSQIGTDTSFNKDFLNNRNEH